MSTDWRDVAEAIEKLIDVKLASRDEAPGLHTDEESRQPDTEVDDVRAELARALEKASGNRTA